MSHSSSPTVDCGIAPFPPFDPSKLLLNHSQENVDIRTLSQIDRQGLTKGIGIRIYCDARWSFVVPWRLFQAVSIKAKLVDMRNPTALEFALPKNIDQSPFKVIVKWLVEAANFKEVPQLRGTDSFLDDLALIRAGKILGMDVYVQPIFNYYWAYIKNHLPTYEELDTIVFLALSSDDPFLNCTARRLAYLTLKDEIPDPENMENYMHAHPLLGQAVDTALVELRCHQHRPKRC